MDSIGTTLAAQGGLQAILAVLFAFLIEKAKQASWFPFLTAQSAKWWKVTFSAILAAGQAAGIAFAFHDGVLTVSGLTWGAVGQSLLAFGWSWLVQHVTYEKGVRTTGTPSGTAGKIAAVVLAIGALLSTAGCGTTTQGKVRTTALVVHEAAAAIDDAEQTAYQAGMYSAAIHKEVGGYILTLLRADRAYLTLASTLPANPDVASLAKLAGAKQEILTAATDVARVLRTFPGAAGVIQKVEAYLEGLGLKLGMTAMWAGSQTHASQVPLPVPLHAGADISLLLALLLKMYSDGRLSAKKIQGLLRKSGATDEELAAALADADARIKAREAEQAKL